MKNHIKILLSVYIVGAFVACGSPNVSFTDVAHAEPNAAGAAGLSTAAAAAAAGGANAIANTGGAATCGCVGEVGLQGDIGPQGPQGIPGPQGPAGTNAVCAPELGQCPAGVPGRDGVPGVPGATGPQGLTGAVGPTGATGAQGPVGPQGLQGPAGKDGKDGKDGTSLSLTKANLYMVGTQYNTSATCNDNNDVLLTYTCTCSGGANCLGATFTGGIVSPASPAGVICNQGPGSGAPAATAMVVCINVPN